MSALPAWVTRMNRVAALPTHGPAERAVVLAALRWANVDGLLWPALANWAALAGVPVRTLQRVLRRLEGRGIVIAVAPSTGGVRRTGRYLIPAMAENPDALPGFEPRPARPETPTQTPPNPDGRAPQPRRCVTRSDKDQREEQPSTPGGVVARLSPELRSHPNATPERLAWIAREAPSKNNPAGWAAKAIREGWNPPPPSEADARAARRAEREGVLARFDTMPEAQRAAIIAEARREFSKPC